MHKIKIKIEFSISTASLLNTTFVLRENVKRELAKREVGERC
jgi:hypothetical protein